MIDKALNTIATTESFYFQLYPLSLAIVNPDCDLPAPGTTYRFNILKGISRETQVSRSSTRRDFRLKQVSGRSAEGM